MNLVVATQNFPPIVGGIEQVAEQLCSALAARGARLTVVAPAHAQASAFDSALSYRVLRYVAPNSKELPLARALRTPMKSADACLSMQFSSLPGALLWRPGLAVPVATLIHGKEVLPSRVLFDFAVRRIRRSLLRRADHVFAVSRYSAARAISAGAIADRVRVVHPGVDSHRFRPAELRGGVSSARDPMLLTVCRLVERKGVDTVIEALPAVLREHPRLTYYVVGDGPDRARLERLVARAQLGAHVRFVGKVPNERLLELYASATLFVMVSRALEVEGDVEGFGLVLLEAQACGVPVVAAESGGMPDALLAERTGFLVAPGDAPALARQLLSALESPARLLEMRMAARLFAERSSWSRMAQEIIEALAEPRPVL